MKRRPNKYSKPLTGERKENYHPADVNNPYYEDSQDWMAEAEAEIKELKELLKLTGGRCKRYLPKEVKIRLKQALDESRPTG